MARRKQLMEHLEEVKLWSEESETFNIKGKIGLVMWTSEPSHWVLFPRPCSFWFLTFQEIRLEDESLYFTYDNGDKKQKETFVFHLSDYPGTFHFDPRFPVLITRIVVTWDRWHEHALRFHVQRAKDDFGEPTESVEGNIKG